MWKNIIILVFLVMTFFTTQSFCQNNKNNVDESLVGKWEAAVGDFRQVTTIQQDGTWIAESYCPRKETPDRMTGSWKVRDNKIIWTYDKDNSIFRAGEEDINPLLEMTKDKFVLKETDGRITTFRRIDDNKKE